MHDGRQKSGVRGVVPRMRSQAAFLIIVFGAHFMLSGVTRARPFYVPTVPELMQVAQAAVVIKPKATRVTTDRPDDDSMGRDLALYQGLETECEVLAVMKGPQISGKIKVVHFAFASRKPEFNGGHFMAFLFDPTRFVVFPKGEGIEPDASMKLPYAEGAPEYLAFLRKTPDGRYAPVTPHYDGGHAFRLLSVPIQAQRYHDHVDTPGKEKKVEASDAKPETKSSK